MRLCHKAVDHLFLLVGLTYLTDLYERTMTATTLLRVAHKFFCAFPTKHDLAGIDTNSCP